MNIAAIFCRFSASSILLALLLISDIARFVLAGRKRFSLHLRAE